LITWCRSRRGSSRGVKRRPRTASLLLLLLLLRIPLLLLLLPLLLILLILRSNQCCYICRCRGWVGHLNRQSSAARNTCTLPAEVLQAECDSCGTCSATDSAECRVYCGGLPE
jgi:hypothetical protein